MIVSHPQMLYYLAVTQIDEARRLARRSTESVKVRRRLRARQPVSTPNERVEVEVERVPSLV